MHCCPETLLEQHRDFGGRNGYENIDQQRYRAEPSEKAQDQQRPAHDFDDTDKGPCERWRGNPDMSEAAAAERGGKEKFLDAFGDKDPSDKNAQQQKADGLLLHNKRLSLARDRIAGDRPMFKSISTTSSLTAN